MARELLDTQKDYDVIGDGVVDCTQGLLDAAADAKAIITAGDACDIKLPTGDICLQSMLELIGTTAGAPRLIGVDGGAFDLSSSRLVWKGPLDAQGNPQGTVLKTTAFNRGRISNVAINMGNAAVGLCASAPTSPTQASTSGANFKRMTIGSTLANTIGITLGTDPATTGNQTYQFSESHWRDITYIGPGTAIKSLSPGNCKNHDFGRLNINGAAVALDLDRGSGLLSVKGLVAGNVGIVAKCSGGQLKVLGYEVEVSNRSFQLFTGTMDWGTSISFESGECDWSGDPNGLGVLFRAAGAIHLARSTFIYRDTLGNLQPFAMQHTRCVAGTFGNFISEQCTYFGCATASRPYIPLYDGAQGLTSPGNDLTPATGSYGSLPGINPRATSKWDTGTDTSGNPIVLTNFG